MLVENPNAHPTALMKELTVLLGPGVYGFEPETILMHFKRIGHPIHRDNLQKIEAMRAITNSNKLQMSWPIFEKITMGLNGLPVRFDIVQPPTISELWFALDIMFQTRPGLRFVGDVPNYIAAVLQYRGATMALPPMHFIGKLMPRQDKVKDMDKLLEKTPVRIPADMLHEYYLWLAAKRRIDSLEDSLLSQDVEWRDDDEPAMD